jgi:hypothetical protein
MLQQQPVVVKQKLIVSVVCFLASVWSLFYNGKRLGRARLPALMKNRDVGLVTDFVQATLRCCCCLLWATGLQRWEREREREGRTYSHNANRVWRHNDCLWPVSWPICEGTITAGAWCCGDFGMCVRVQVEVAGERVEQQQQ